MKRQLPLQFLGCVAALTLIVAATGCNDTKKKSQPAQSTSSDYGLDYMGSGTTASGYDSTTYDTTVTDPYGDTASTSTTVDTSWTDSVGSSNNSYGYNTPPSNDMYAAQTTYTDTTYTPAPVMNAGGRIHVVQKKETLSTIALQYYGRKSWKRIYEANLDQISDPNRIYPGMQLVIP